VTVRTELATPPRVVPVRSARLPALPPLAFGVEVAGEPPSRSVEELRTLLAELLRRAAAGRPQHARGRAGRSRAQPRAAR
jgi:hypothetical protein